jgi:uncharacterized protein YoaH (UPF0181 family)
MGTLHDVGEAIGKLAERIDALMASRRSQSTGAYARGAIREKYKSGREKIAGDRGVIEMEQELARNGVTKPNGEPIKLVSEEMRQAHEARMRKYGPGTHTIPTEKKLHQKRK